MADLPESEDATSGIDDVMRRPALRFVDDEGAVARRRFGFSWHVRVRTLPGARRKPVRAHGCAQARARPSGVKTLRQIQRLSRRRRDPQELKLIRAPARATADQDAGFLVCRKSSSIRWLYSSE